VKPIKLKVLKTDRDHKAALKVIEENWDARPGTPEYDAVEVLAVLVEDYERRRFPMEDPDPIEAIRFRMEQANLTQADLVPILGSRSRVSEVLAGKRRLTLTMVRRLFDELHIPLEVLLPAARDGR
jgi:HTH-type transcriptional regulator/antitoxin HigA